MTEFKQNLDHKINATSSVDAVIVGAGFAGLYMLYRLKSLGFSARIFEAGNGVGGTWYWNCYPGARCDIESLQYSYSFSEELRQEWHWTERYASQPEILRYLNYVADKFDLCKDIQFGSRVTAAIFDETLSYWNIQTDRDNRVSARFCIMATGCLSKPNIPNIKGLDTFKGNIYHTALWPHEMVDFHDQRVAVIGTGSSGIQIIPIIAEQAIHAYIFQRTASFSIPGYNGPLDAEKEHLYQANYHEHRRRVFESFGGIEPVGLANDKSAVNASPEEQQQTYESQWRIGGLTFLNAFNDLLFKKEANDTAAQFIRSKIRETVKDPLVAEALIPYDYPVGSKRLCVDNHYFETYNRENVTLIDLREEKIEEIITVGIQTTSRIYEVESIIFATGFDSTTGALFNIDIQGQSGFKIREKWATGPRTYLGIMSANFPNLFFITGPGSPSVLSNMVFSIEQHVDWIADCLDYLHKNHYDTIEATVEAEHAWMNHVQDVANATLFPVANSWYVGANIPGKPRVFTIYVGGVPAYRKKCESVVANGYEGFHLTKHGP